MADASGTLRSRRTVVLGSLGALAALVGQSLGRPVAAADDDVVKVGNSHDATSTTRIQNLTDSSTVFWGRSSTGVGVRGSSTSNIGGSFTSTSGLAVRGSSSSGNGGYFTSSSKGGLVGIGLQKPGVIGFSGPAASAPDSGPSNVGVYGIVEAANGLGVAGESHDGTGVLGNSANGTGVFGNSATGTGVSGAGGQSGVLGTKSGSVASKHAAVKGLALGGGVGIYGWSGSPPEATAPAGRGVYGATTIAGGVGVHGVSQNGGTGVRGVSDGIGVEGTTGEGIGVSGEASADGSSGIGVKGRTQGVTGVGVLGICDEDDPAAVGVKGIGATGVLGSTDAGVGVKGIATTASAFAGLFQGKVGISRFIELDEIALPAAPAADQARLFVRDNGSGKSQLCVRFTNGAVVVLATQA